MGEHEQILKYEGAWEKIGEWKGTQEYERSYLIFWEQNGMQNDLFWDTVNNTQPPRDLEMVR